jgi:hypothetical protein
MMFMNKVSWCLLLSMGDLIASPAESPPAATNAFPKQVPWPAPVNPPDPLENSVAALTNTSLRMLEPGIFEIGKVRLDQPRRTITLPAVLDKSQGPMEYFLVTTYGKTHESILKTPAEPYHIHLAMLLLGAAGSGKANFPGVPTNGIPGPVVHPSKETIPGNRVTIGVRWKMAADDIQHPAEEMVSRLDPASSASPSAMEHGFWVYNGSLIIRHTFLAQADGSIISLVTDPVALINSTAPGHDNDQIWVGNTNNLPPAGVPVEVAITLEDIKPK